MASRSPRGRLPQRVYWFRRTVVLVVAAALVFGIGKLIGSGSDQPAEQASATASTPKASGTASPTSNVPFGPVSSGKVRVPASQAPLIPPSGKCAADEVSVLPSVPKAAAGGPIILHLSLEGTQPACSFAVSPESLVVKITSGADRIWSSQDCPGSIRTSSVVVRSGLPADVPVIWSGRRSDDECSHSTQWALPGFYHVYAAALGSTPTDVQFEVTIPNRPVVTRTAHPKKVAAASQSPTPTATPKATTKQPAKKPTTKPTAKPSVNGKGSACGGDNAAGSC
jgi:hypothetical protein